MKVIILAAGRGARMNSLTDTLPKPMLIHQGKNLLEHKLNILPSNTTEIIIVIGYLGHMIKEYFGDSHKEIPIRYVTQSEMNGTAGALWLCRDFLDGSFMVLMADDIYNKSDLKTLSQTPQTHWSILTYSESKPTIAGKIVVDNSNRFIKIHEDDGTSPHTLLYTGACVLTPEIFTKPMVQISDTEFGLPHSFAQFASTKKIKVIETTNWIRITSPHDLQD